MFYYQATSPLHLPSFLHFISIEQVRLYYQLIPPKSKDQAYMPQESWRKRA
jgi:hypothetical protein